MNKWSALCSIVLFASIAFAMHSCFKYASVGTSEVQTRLIEDTKVKVEQQKTEQLRIQWKIDSLKAENK
jgi:hypothetical protein